MIQLLTDYLKSEEGIGRLYEDEEISEQSIVLKGDSVQYRIYGENRTREVDVADILEWMYKQIQECQTLK